MRAMTSASRSLVTGVDFVYVPALDFDRAVAFYGDVLGLPQSAGYGQMPGAEFETGTLTLAVVQSEAFRLRFQANNHPIALHVDDVAAARAELEARGVVFNGETIDSGVCHMAFFLDPEGNALMLHHRYAPKPARDAPTAAA
jgi:predicted enzyme related to lactoylglutathione lyase